MIRRCRRLPGVICRRRFHLDFFWWSFWFGLLWLIVVGCRGSVTVITYERVESVSAAADTSPTPGTRINGGSCCSLEQREKVAFCTIDRWQISLFINHELQSPLGFATLDKAAALALATATPLTDLRQYMNSHLGFSNLKI